MYKARRHTKLGLQAGKTAHTKKHQKNNYIDDELSGYTVFSLKAVRHSHILFVYMVCSVFSACSPDLVYHGPKIAT